MARNFGFNNSNNGGNDKQVNAAAFTNIHMPKVDEATGQITAGKRLCFIMWDGDDGTQAHIAKHLLAEKAKGEEAYIKALEIVLSGLVFVTNSAEKVSTTAPKELFDFSEAS